MKLVHEDISSVVVNTSMTCQHKVIISQLLFFALTGCSASVSLYSSSPDDEMCKLCFSSVAADSI